MATTGNSLQPVTRYLILNDKQLREMRLTFRAKAQLEEFMTPHIEALATELGRPLEKEDMELLTIRGMGSLMQLAHMAWIYTTTWRRKHEPELTFDDFLDLFPEGPEDLAAISAAIEAVSPKGADASEGNADAAAQ